MGADIALLPEMWNVGYTPAVHTPGEDLYRAPELWPENGTEPPIPEGVWQGAIILDDPFLRHFRELAAELEMAIALTFLRRTDGGPGNSLALIDRHGELVLTYDKVHTCVFDLPEVALRPGDRFGVVPLDTAAGEVMACELEPNRMGQFRTRAMENMVAVAMANYPGPGWGHSAAFDGIAFDDGRSRDKLVVEAGEAEGVYPAIVDLDRLRDYRRREGWGDAFRRPSTYRSLAEDRVRPPFVRVDRAGRAAPR